MFAYYINLILFLLSLSILIFFSYKPIKNYAFIFKVITSILFITIAIIAYLQISKNYYSILIIIGLIFSLFGDICLGLNCKNNDASLNNIFLLGLINFSITHIMYISAFVYISSFKIIDLNISLVLSIFTILVLKFNKNIDFKNMFKPACIYSFLIYLMSYESIKLALIYSNIPISFLLITGSLLFIISDLILSFIIFHRNPTKILKGINLFTYYIAQLLIASTLLFIS